MDRTASPGSARHVLLAVCGAVLLFNPWSSGADVASVDAAGPDEPDSERMPISVEEGLVKLVGTVDIRSLPVPSADDSSFGAVLPIRRLNAIADGGIEASGGADAVLTSVAPGAGPLSPPSVLSGFAGLGSSDNAFASIPPDTQLAVGPTYMVEMVNNTGRILNKTGAVQQTFSLSSFFFVPTGYSNFDPKVIFDSTSSRFFATYVSYCDNATFFCVTDTGKLHFAVSTSSDPLTQPWKQYVLTLTNDFPDYPGIGLTDDKFTVSYNRFDVDGPPGAISPGCTASGYCGVEVLVLQKSDLVAGVTLPAGALSLPDLSHSSIRPAHSLSSTSTQYLASVSAGSSSIIHLWQVTGTPALGNTALTQVAHTAIATLILACPGSACARQLGTASLIDSGDNRVLETVWRNGSMWVAATGTCNWTGDTATRSCLKLVEVNTTNNTILQDFMFGAFGAYYYYPAIRTDASNNLHVVYTRSSSSEYAHVRVAGRQSTDTPNTMSGDTVVKAGEVSYLPGIGSSPYRWGDYSGAALDPSDPSIVWVAGTYAKIDGAERWGTWISKLQHGGAPTPTGTFEVGKDFVPDDAASVTVAVVCDNSATPDQATKAASEAAPASFTITLPAGPANCTATESPTPPGYIEDNSGCASQAVTASITTQCTITNAPTDADVDGVPDSIDNCPNWHNPTQVLPPWPIPADDPDCDGFSTTDENGIGTDPTVACDDGLGLPDWPPDFDDDKTIDIIDVLALRPVFGEPVAGVNERFDLSPGGGTTINIIDVLAMRPVFNESCG